MTNPSCLIDLKHTLPQASWPEVISALRQDAHVWNSLQNPDFRRTAISKLGGYPEKWTPAHLAMLALKPDLSLAMLRTQSLSEIDPELRVQAIQTYELHAGDSPPKMDLTTAGLLMLALLEHYRLTHSWESIPKSEHWETAFACLFGCIDKPLPLLITLPPSLATHILLSNPIDFGEKAQNFMGILVSVSRLQQLTILRELALQRPRLSQHLAQQLWKTPISDSNRRPLTENLRAYLLTHFEKIHTLTTDLNNVLLQAEAQLNAGYGDLTDASLRTAWQTSQQLQNLLLAQFSQAAAHAGDITQIQANWQTAKDTIERPVEDTAALALMLIDKDQIEIAETLLYETEGDSHPLVLLAQSRIAYKQGNLAAAKETANKVYQQATSLEPFFALLLARNLLSLKMAAQATDILESLRHDQPNHIELIHLTAQAHAAVGAFPQAIQAIHLATALAPNRIDLLHDYAQIHEFFGQWTAALEARQTVLEIQSEPQVSDLRALAACYLKTKQHQKAQEICLRALRVFPDDGPIQAILGETLQQKGQHKKANEHFQIAIQAAPEEPLPWLVLARAQQEVEGLQVARETLRKAILAAPDHAEIQLALGENYLQAGSITQALTCLQQADQLAKALPAIESFHLRGQIALPLTKALFDLGRADEALTTIQSVSPLPEKQAAQLHLHARILLFMGRAQEAIPFLAKAQMANPSDVSIGLDYAQAQLESGSDPEKAVHTLQAILENDPKNPEALALLAEALHANGNTIEALSIYRKALNTRLNEDSQWYPRLSIGLAKTAIALGQPETALAALQQAWQNNPQNLEILQTLSEAYAAVHLDEQAQQTAILAWNIAPLSLENLIWFADLMVNMQTYDQAAHALNSAIELAPQRANLLLRLGEIHQLVGDFKNAQQTFRKIADLDQASPQELYTAASHLKALHYPEDAVTCLRIAVRRCQEPPAKSTCTKLLTELIDAYLQLEKPTDALMALDEYIDHQPNNLDLIGQRIILLHQLGQNSEAIEILENSLEENPTYHPLLLVAAQLHYALGNLPLALEHAQKALINYQELEEAYSPVHILALAADINDACLLVKDAQEILEIPLAVADLPANLDYYCLRSEIALKAENEIEAAQALTAALKINPEHPRVLALQARLTARHGDFSSAQVTLQNALTAWGKYSKHKIYSPVSVLALADAALELYQWSTAIFMLQEAANRFPQEPRAHLQLARGMALRAEYQRLCITLRVIQHAPGSSAINEFSHRSFEQSILAASQASEETSSTEIQTEIAHWQLRGQAIFQPSAEYARALGEISQTPESRAALLAALRHSSDQQNDRQTALESFATASYRQMHKKEVNPKLFVQIALALSNQNHPIAVSAAQSALDQGIRLRHPSVPIFYAVQAYVAEQANDEPSVVQALENALAHWPDESEWHAWIAETQQKLPQVDLNIVIEHLQKAITLNPKNGFYFLKLGQAYLQSKDPKTAITTLEQATHFLPEHAAPWYALARAFKLTDEFAQTFQNAERAAELDPNNLDPQILMIETAMEIGNPEKALQYCEAALNIEPKHPEVLLLQARALDLTGKSTAAIQAFDKALAQKSKSVPLLLEHAQIMQRAAGNRSAIKELRELSEEYPDDARVLAMLAEILIESDQSDPAVQVAQKALHTNQGDLDCTQEAHLLKMLGRMMRRNGQLDHAIQYLSEAIQCNPETVEAYIELGRAYQERRQHSQALDAFHQAIAVAPGDYRAYYHAGQVFKATKDYNAAEDMLKRAAKLAPNDLAIRRQLGGLVALNLVHNPKEGADLYVD